MSFSITNRALLRGMLAGAVVLTGTACSRSDRAKSGPDNTAAAVPDTSSNAAQPSNSGTVTGAVSDTATPSDQSSSAAGYRSMERDTASPSNQHSDSARVTADSSVSQAAPVTSDSATTEMARDTSTVADQADTAAANGDVALRATVDTSSEANADVSAYEGDETADEQVVRPEDRATVAASETPQDDVGAAAIGGDVTGADAVALMSRAGLRCAVVDPEANQAIRWDMSNTPIALNPCGMGSMILSKIWTEK